MKKRVKKTNMSAGSGTGSSGEGCPEICDEPQYDALRTDPAGFAGIDDNRGRKSALLFSGRDGTKSGGIPAAGFT